jgi:hypothetical protein
MNDIMTLRQTAADYRRLADNAADPARHDAYLDVARALEIALNRLGNPPDTTEQTGPQGDR